MLRLKSEEEEGDMCRGVGRTCQQQGGDDNFSHLNYLFVEGKSPEYVQVTGLFMFLTSALFDVSNLTFL